jgi:quercetin dioxygenase-like cupin family protein
MDISRDVATAKGPAETFTGEVWIDPITRGLPPSQLNVAAVHFTPGARSAGHSHNGGQTLYITEGHGLVQARGTRSSNSARAMSFSRPTAKNTGTEPGPTTS